MLDGLKMIKIISTNHLMPKTEIYKILNKENPDIIAVELCGTRYNLMVLPLINNLIDDKPKSKDESVLGKISSAIKDKADKEGLDYAADQISSCLYAKENDLPLEFVDLDITKTKYLMDILPENEKQGFMNELLSFEKTNLKEQTKNINEEEILIKMKEKFPIAFEFLVNMRNLVIINNILKLKIKYPNKKVIIMLGAGHVKIVSGAIDG